MEENEEYGLPDVDADPVDRGSQGTPKSAPPRNKAKKQSSDSRTPMIIFLVIVAVLVVGGILYYFLSYAPKQAQQEELARQEQLRLDQEAAEQAAEQARLDSIAAVEEEARQAEMAAAEAEPEVGAVTVLSEKTGRSYVVIGSFFDGDMAMDAGNKLASEGVSTFILEPVGDVKFYRLAVADFDSYGEASASVGEYQGTYGDEIWALRY